MGKCRVKQFVLISLLTVLFSLQNTFAQPTTSITAIVSPNSDLTNYNVFLSAFTYTNGNVSGNGVLRLLSITNDSEIVPIQVIGQSNFLTLYIFQVVVPLDVLSKTYTMAWTNYTFGTNSSEPFTVGQAQFTTFLQPSQSVFVGSLFTFSAQACHTTGYQWQKDGTNLVEDGHFIGVTKATLTITNVQLSDTGNYTVIANHPTSPASADASLSVYKPIQLGLAALPSPGGFELLVANQDGSAFESERVPNLQIYSTTNLTLDFADWNIETNTGVISNGVLQIDFPDDGSGGRYWHVTEQYP
jgi:hypothetical protein